MVKRYRPFYQINIQGFTFDMTDVKVIQDDSGPVVMWEDHIQSLAASEKRLEQEQALNKQLEASLTRMEDDRNMWRDMAADHARALMKIRTALNGDQ